MVRKILADGYKSINRIEMELREFTLLSGVNSAGKSSIIQALLYVIQKQKEKDNSEGDCKYVDLGRFADIKNTIKGNKNIQFKIEIKEDVKTYTSEVHISGGNSVSLVGLRMSSEEDVSSHN